MKICLYSPYLPQHTGGGEKYFLDVARLLAEKHTVTVVIPGLKSDQVSGIRQLYAAFLGSSLDKVGFRDGPINSETSWWKKALWTRQFDVVYYLTDGSFFFSLAGRNIAHIQIPFTQPKTSLFERLKLANWDIKNTNSEFTKSVIEKNWQTHIQFVHWPMIEVPPAYQAVKLTAKKPIILNVGRFFTHQHSKRQDVLVEFFKHIVDKHPAQMKGWKLVLLGTVEDQAYADRIQKAADGYPIELVHTATRNQVWEHYQAASIYWHATGFEADEKTEPEKVEHFGISTVEAMAVGCAPVVIGKGGQPEVLGSQLKAWLWLSEAECLAKTIQLIEQPQLLREVQTLAQNQAAIFNQARFTATLADMIGEPL